MNDFMGIILFVVSIHRWTYKLVMLFQVKMFFLALKYEIDLYVVFGPVELLVLWVLVISLIFHIVDSSDGNSVF